MENKTLTYAEKLAQEKGIQYVPGTVSIIYKGMATDGYNRYPRGHLRYMAPGETEHSVKGILLDYEIMSEILSTAPLPGTGE